METITLTFNTGSPFAASIDAFLKTLPPSVKVRKSVKPKNSKADKDSAKKKRFLSKLTKAGQQAIDLASMPHESYSAEELIASLYD